VQSAQTITIKIAHPERMPPGKQRHLARMDQYGQTYCPVKVFGWTLFSLHKSSIRPTPKSSIRAISRCSVLLRSHPVDFHCSSGYPFPLDSVVSFSTAAAAQEKAVPIHIERGEYGSDGRHMQKQRRGVMITLVNLALQFQRRCFVSRQWTKLARPAEQM